MNGDRNNDWRFGGGPSASVLSGGHVGDTWKDAPVTVTSRVMPGPSGTNWNSTLAQNPALNSGNSGSQQSGNSWIKGDSNTPGHYGINDAMFRSASNQSQPDASSFYKDRTANMDLTKRDHELYGAGGDVGFSV